MSAAAVMLVKDEADVVGYTLEHLLGEVDEVIVSDNGSTDGSRDIAAALDGVVLLDDDELGYYQDRKTTALAALALDRGHEWVVPCDADEFWYAPDGRPIRQFLAGLAPDVAYVTAALYNHIPTALDPPAACAVCGDRGWTTEPGPEPDLPNQVACEVGEPNPFARIGWRQREHGALGKVACRARPGLEIGMGNHSAWAPGSGITVGGLVIRHYSWRSRDQYVAKIANGARAYAATDKPENVGAHWRMFGLPEDDPGGVDGWAERVGDWFDRWFWRPDPYADDTLIYDPAPMRVLPVSEAQG